MEIPQDLLQYCESCYKWDDDRRQEVYVKILELEDGTEINKGWCVEVYQNLASNTRRDEENRTQLRADNYDAIVRNLGLAGQADDPSGILESDDEILTKLDSLSAVLRDTLIEYYVEGRSPEDVAEANNENVEAVRKRITRARNQLKGV